MFQMGRIMNAHGKLKVVVKIQLISKRWTPSVSMDENLERSCLCMPGASMRHFTFRRNARVSVYVRNWITSGVYIMPKKNNAVEVGEELQFEAVVVTKADGKSDEIVWSLVNPESSIASGTQK